MNLCNRPQEEQELIEEYIFKFQRLLHKTNGDMTLEEKINYYNDGSEYYINY